ncbi:MAG: tryptophanase [Bacteroidales bacterium]|nr:tryptophanase [Bacteroidales bacterium]
MELPYIEPYKIKMVEGIRRSTPKERAVWLKDAKYNLFNLKSEQVVIDLLTDSGTSAMSDKQWSEIMLGDESYAGSSSYYKLKKAIFEITGFEYFLPTHQGRAAENVLFSTLIKEGDLIPGNSHFDTTKGHIEFRKATAIDCTINEAFDTSSQHPFKGNINLDKLEHVLSTYPYGKVPMIILTVTCNSSGGQPVSMENISAVSKLARKYGTLLFFDAARFAENAYFIKTREKGYEKRPISDIVLEMFSYADGMTMSSKKDAIVNIGGFVAFREKKLYEKASTFNILFEGFLTYGGLAGRDMSAMAQGLHEGIQFDYLESRTNQVKYLATLLSDYGIPIQKPVGGHAVFLDAKKFLPQIPKEEFIAQTLALEIYLEAGVRTVEVGTLLADRDPVSRENRYPDLEFVRLAIPRRVYTLNHLSYVAAAIKNIFDRKNNIQRGYKIIKEAPIMRHFTVELDRL